MPMYTVPGGRYGVAGWDSVPAFVPDWDDDPPARRRASGPRKPKAPEPEPVVRPVGRLYDLDD